MSDEAKSVARDSALSVSRKFRGCSGCIAWVFTAMFLGIGGVFYYMLALRPWYGMLQAQNWSSTPCTVVSSEIMGDGDSSKIHVVFKYSVEQKEYQSQTYCFVSMSSNTATGWKRLARRVGRVIETHQSLSMTRPTLRENSLDQLAMHVG